MNEKQSSRAYDFQAFEKKWQDYWEENKTFKAEYDPARPKFYCLDMFPYPSGSGLHVGHPEGYTATDIVSRFKRMKGFNVLHPMGWDAFGLPAEQYAIETGTHPKETTAQNVDLFRKQLKMLGFSYDWDREINTTDERYYKWTQWIFLKLYEKGLAYQSEEPVNWCPALGTVLANEEVIDGKSERGGHPVIKKPMRQWVLKITEYAERLLADLDELEWPESLKEMQRNWIGKSYGANIDFQVVGCDSSFRVYTTRPDTLFGATFCVLAPEHPLVAQMTQPSRRDQVEEYVESTLHKTDRERTVVAEGKTGVDTGARAVNPANGEEIPIFIADYVLMSYGYGAIMAVPGHDERDHEFARRYDLPIRRVVTGGEEGDIYKAAHHGDGTLINSGFLNALDRDEAIREMIGWLEREGRGEGAVNYKIRDWLFSRQRYWGEPFPLAHDEQGHVITLEEDLPVLLPELDDYLPSETGEPPLSRAQDWLYFERNGVRYRRETNTMPQWAGSCWYFIRFVDANNDAEPWDPAVEAYWMPVDLYIGGAEHAVLHLLYARFWQKVLYDLGYASTSEPFKKVINQGMILGENGERMSKSRGNVVNPDDVVQQWGADSFRLYEMFMGPLEAVKSWQTNGIAGVHRFLSRFWRLVVDSDGEISQRVQAEAESETFQRHLHRTVKKVTEDIEVLQFNTAISAMMELLNAAYKEPGITGESLETFLLLLSPFAPHLGEEIWSRLGHSRTLAYEPWPEYGAELVQAETVTISIQVNGKLRGTLTVPAGMEQETVVEQAREVQGVQRHLEGRTVRKEIFVPGRIVNFVVK